MNKLLIDTNAYPVRDVLEILLKDKTTKKNIIFATDTYSDYYGKPIPATSQITGGLISGFGYCKIQPRVYKSFADQQYRTRTNAEVFTPTWIVNKMNNYLDEDWFGRKDVFNSENDSSWVTNNDIITFPEGKTWMDYIASKRLEITCGEAPYLVSRYDSTTGEIIPVGQRIGLLDRKLRVVGENTSDENTWLKWALEAFKSTYGYEYQGDNLLIARINLLNTFVEYFEDKWSHLPFDRDLRKIANVISWNIWQMDGLTGTIPLGRPYVEGEQLQLDLFFPDDKPEQLQMDFETEETEPSRIFDWKANKSITYNSLKEVRR